MCLHTFAMSTNTYEKMANELIVKNRFFNNQDITINTDSSMLCDTVKDVDTLMIYKKENLKLDLINEVDSYIRKYFPKAPSNLADILVANAIEHDFDLCFMMAQTQIETGFGTAGAGRTSSRRSLFGVCKRYKNYENAVDDYCRLVNKSYLGSKRTIHDLMRNYITLGGARYAGNRSYEKELKRQYNVIKSNTKISKMQSDLQKMS